MGIWKGILIHHSASADTEDCNAAMIADWHTLHRGWDWIGYHSLCEKIGDHYQVVMGRPLHVHGSHCPGKNKSHLGHCLVGNFQYEAPPPEQLLVSARHCAGLCAVLGFGVEAIGRHDEFRQTICPGKLNIEQFRGMVAALMLSPGTYYPPPAKVFPAAPTPATE